MSENTARTYLAEHPRLLGYLFAIGMMVSQAGAVAANSLGTNPGP